ncbi:MAG: DegT/DnrJ/EryC1/StrS family aminotransferase [Gemmataceae bacterium]|nr:DegT/DnrJ/EryC1/StrS family aminotransferase [Gemmataceae bacterium]
MRIPLSDVDLAEAERGYVHSALASGWISGTGEFVGRFERAIAERISRRHVIAVCNGTAALELGLRALGIGAGDEVIVPALTFAAPAAGVCAVGALPVLADIDTATWTISPGEVRRLVTRRTKAIIAVDLLGHPCDYDALEEVGLPIIEDAAQAHGAAYKGKPAGAFGIVSTFSFHVNKTITCGEGGCVATDDDALAAKMRLIANHGMTKERPYHHPVVGRNFRMPNLIAAVGLGQAERWGVLVRARQAVAAHYDRLLATAPVIRRPVAPWATEACWLYTVSVPRRDDVVEMLNREGIEARAVWTALPDQAVFHPGCRSEYPVARRIADSALWLPTWSGMPPERVREVAEALKQALGFSRPVAGGIAESELTRTVPTCLQQLGGET